MLFNPLISAANNFKRKISSFFRQFYKVPYCVPAWGWAEHWTILRCFVTGRLIQGNDKEKLYEMIKAKTGVKYVFGFNSGREAIQAALLAKGIGVGDRVVMPSYCCESVARAVTATGARPLFCDIDNDYNPDVDDIVKKVNSSMKAIIFPHLFGNPGPIDRLERELEKKGIRSKIFLIDDAAQSFGAELKGRLVGTFGDAGIISFGPGKTMTASGGGLLLTNSEDLADKLASMELNTISINNKLRRLTYWVIFRRWRRFTLPLYPYVARFLEIQENQDKKLIGLCNMDAVIAIEQFKKLDYLLGIRVERKRILDKHISKIDFVDNLLLGGNSESPESLNVATKYLVRLNCAESYAYGLNLYKKIMEDSGIEIQPLYVPMHTKPIYSSNKVYLPKTESYHDKILQIPVEPSISAQDFRIILDRFDSFCKRLINSHSRN